MLPVAMSDSQILTYRLNQKERWLGISIALFSAASFGLMPIFAAVSYDGGANAVTFAVVRTIGILTIIIPILLLLKRSWRISRIAFVPVGFFVISQVGLSIGILSSIQFIPISLAILIVYIYPSLVLVIEAVIYRQKITPVHILACLAAFSGLALVLAPSIGEIDWRGVAFAGLACVSLTIMMISTHQARRNVNETTLLFWGNAGGLPIVLVLVPLLGGVALPTTQLSWVALGVGTCLFALGFWAYVVSMRFISASRASMLFNFEPIVAILASAFFLGEALVLPQLFGASLVIFAVFLATRS
jgi:drug/metabolite transporter (DMT)-like permease